MRRLLLAAALAAAPAPALAAPAPALAAALVPALAALPPATVIGHSVQGRPISVVRVGDPAAPHKVLVVGEVHGNEPAGRTIVDALRRATPAADTQLLLIRDLNPDGFAHHMRTNADGVDLNRNSPQHWAGAGPRPWSEPETRALRDFILRERPTLTIYYHQPFGLVDLPEGGHPQAAREYSELTGLPLHRLSRRPGSLSRWQNVRIDPGSAFVVELAPGHLPPALRLRHVAAVLAL
jgi:murein peptide amidase A